MQHRTLKALALALALSTAATAAAAQDFVFSWNPRSGDTWVDTRLGDINHYGYRYREPFIDEMTRYYGAPRELVSDLLLNRRWAPGDVYYACAIAQIIGRPCRYVVDEWDRDHGQGWGVVAQRLGIKPGSAEFHRLKRGFVPTYDRWSRPIELDDDLRREFPNRGKGASNAGGNKPAKSVGANKAGNGQRNASPAAKPAGNKGSQGNRGESRGSDKGGKGNSGKGNGKG